MSLDLSTLIEQLIDRSSAGEELEREKVELKREWYNLTDQKDLNEFLKDIVALANTPGPTGYLVIGVDKNGQLRNSPFSESKLRDQSDIHQILVKHVDLPVHLVFHEVPVTNSRGHVIISVFEIPPSIEKPHFIRRYLSKKGREIENYIPIRKTTGIFPANRFDVEFMYYDRKNVEPDYALSILIHRPRLSVNWDQTYVKISFQAAFQNFGRRPIALVESALNLYPPPDLEIPSSFKPKLGYYNSKHISTEYLKIPSNQVETFILHYQALGNSELREKLRNARLKFSVTAVDVNGHTYDSGIIERFA
ncbi:MAG: hypothetical protein A2055_00250 [Deltaproteobacteria bacterium GWA2_47_9]|nr:MAG: hypothetical protein A2055_00250 [Deltaproteobacteria bacterium GWA2_47_9]